MRDIQKNCLQYLLILSFNSLLGNVCDALLLSVGEGGETVRVLGNDVIFRVVDVGIKWSRDSDKVPERKTERERESVCVCVCVFE